MGFSSRWSIAFIHQWFYSCQSRTNNPMWQNQIYFFSYMAWWAIGIIQILIYLFCHQAITGINYSYFQHSRDLTREEQERIDELDNYLVGLSDSSDSREDSNEGRQLSFENLELIFHTKYNKLLHSDEENCTVWLDPIEQDEVVAETLWGHFFHKKWLRTSYERGNELCPNCRINMVTGPEEVSEKDLEENGLLNGSDTRSSFQSTTDE